MEGNRKEKKEAVFSSLKWLGKGWTSDQLCTVFNTQGTDCSLLLSKPMERGNHPGAGCLLCSPEKWTLVIQLEAVPQHLYCVHCVPAHGRSNLTAEREKDTLN